MSRTFGRADARMERTTDETTGCSVADLSALDLLFEGSARSMNSGRAVDTNELPQLSFDSADCGIALVQAQRQSNDPARGLDGLGKFQQGQAIAEGLLRQGLGSIPANHGTGAPLHDLVTPGLGIVSETGIAGLANQKLRQAADPITDALSGNRRPGATTRGTATETSARGFHVMDDPTKPGAQDYVSKASAWRMTAPTARFEVSVNPGDPLRWVDVKVHLPGFNGKEVHFESNGRQIQAVDRHSGKRWELLTDFTWRALPGI
ncbi:MAG TPA: hypothetical protein V6D08_07300 [Candidatus Obscuribacterales bacterium]